MNISKKEIENARETLQGVAYKTDLSYSNTLSGMTGNSVYLKMENYQRTGSFKLRGAYNKIFNLTEKEKKAGVVASSAGNHAQGVALSATLLNVKSFIVMPSKASIVKVKATKSYGANVILHGNNFDEANEAARKLQAEKNLVFVHPYDDLDVIRGQGTIGLEILEDMPDVDVIVVPVGGGGLISGIAVAVKEIKPNVKIIGVEAKNMPSMKEALLTGIPSFYKGFPTIADGIAVGKPGEITFEIIKKYVDDIVLVDEDEIADAIIILMERIKTISEGAGATSVAALLYRLRDYSNKKIVAVVSGGNIDINMVSRIINKGLVKSFRKASFKVVLPDRPGSLWRLLQLIAESGANVLSILHNRERGDINLDSAEVIIDLEVFDRDHIYEIKSLLENHQYEVKLI
ncbi:threonine dehydratase [Thermodesulfobium narugense DSM 14796]|uniref:Threonine dehydratase n=1 Tax=Thermodesulfobium narugense DSM 14796 TaxID=747365 RepID=M1E6N9_9BACT|nr:threonine ammonia-lyase [Thermodesulfobium narugense]AEE14891.1 threonine dehydratase [Thermodesulfobium narugense DSM 14796]